MPAGNQQQQIREIQPVGQARGQRMAFEVVDRVERLAGGRGQRLRRHQPDDQPADQAGTGGGGDRIDIGEPDAGIGERRLDNAVERLDMGARRDLGNDAAERRMLLDLAEHDVGQDVRPATGAKRDDGCRGLVAARLDPENPHRFRRLIHDCRTRISRLGGAKPRLAARVNTDRAP